MIIDKRISKYDTLRSRRSPSDWRLRVIKLSLINRMVKLRGWTSSRAELNPKPLVEIIKLHDYLFLPSETNTVLKKFYK